MALKIRMARGGRRHLPSYKIVVADSRAARDGKFIEKLGTYNPLLPSDHAQRLVLNTDRIKHWLGEGAQPSDRVALFLGKAGLIDMPKWNESPKKSAPKAKAQERVREKEAKAAEKAEAEAAAKAEAAAAAAAPKEEAAAEEAPAAE